MFCLLYVQREQKDVNVFLLFYLRVLCYFDPVTYVLVTER